MVRQPEGTAVGYTQASKVAAVVRPREDEPSTRTRSFTPSRRTAPPSLPVVQVGPFTRVTALPLPEESAAVAPAPSLKAHPATSPTPPPPGSTKLASTVRGP